MLLYSSVQPFGNRRSVLQVLLRLVLECELDSVAMKRPHVGWENKQFQWIDLWPC